MVKGLISIIVPVHNAERFLDKTIECVIDQSYKNWELLLIDDCSTDGSQKIANKYLGDLRIRWIKQKRNVGSAMTRNHGIDLAKGEFICFLDADDLWHSDKLQKQIEFMKDNKCAFSYCSYEFTDEEGHPTGKKVLSKPKMTYKKALKNTIIFTSAVMFNVSMVQKEEIKMPDLKYVEDTATWWKLLRNNITAYGIPEILVYYRRSANTSSSNKIKTQKPLWQLYRKGEHLTFFYAIYCMFIKNFHAILRRV